MKSYEVEFTLSKWSAYWAAIAAAAAVVEYRALKSEDPHAPLCGHLRKVFALGDGQYLKGTRARNAAAAAFWMWFTLHLAVPNSKKKPPMYYVRALLRHKD